MSELVGRLLNCRYRVDASLGRGGMAEVYKVWDEERATYLALKLLREDLAEDQVFLRRFRREAQTLAKLQHPNIVRFYGLEQDSLLAFMLMDFVEGTSLRAEIFQSQGGGLSLQRMLEIMRPVCSALHYAHRQGMVHCDVKPGNILIDKTGRALLTDFGIARMTESATATMVGTGTPAYMSPEQARGKDPTPQTDIYALGVALFEMLTGGERPFTGEHAKTTGSTSEKVRWEQMNLRPPSPRKFNPKISSKLEEVVLKCLEKEPEQRYQSALELLNAVIVAVKEEDIKHEEVKRQVKEKKIETKEEARAPAQPPASPPAAMIPRKNQSAIVIGVMLSIVAMSSIVVGSILHLGGWGQLSGGSVPTLKTPYLPVANVPPRQTFAPSPTITLTPTSTPTPTSIKTPTYQPTATHIPVSNSVTFIVSGKEGWQSTGVTVRKGQRVQIIYKSGTWAGRAGLGPTYPDIWTDAGGIDYQIYYPEFGITGRFASLIGKVGDGSILQIGRSYEFVSEQSGVLYLRMFDTGMSDNDGSINVEITVWP